MHVVSVDEGEHSEEAARGESHPSARRGTPWMRGTVSRRAGDRVKIMDAFRSAATAARASAHVAGGRRKGLS